MLKSLWYFVRYVEIHDAVSDSIVRKKTPGEMLGILWGFPAFTVFVAMVIIATIIKDLAS